jgi:hypothetical protein
MQNLTVSYFVLWLVEDRRIVYTLYESSLIIKRNSMWLDSISYAIFNIDGNVLSVGLSGNLILYGKKHGNSTYGSNFLDIRLWFV